MKFPSHLNCDGKIVSEMGPWSTLSVANAPWSDGLEHPAVENCLHHLATTEQGHLPSCLVGSRDFLRQEVSVVRSCFVRNDSVDDVWRHQFHLVKVPMSSSSGTVAKETSPQRRGHSYDVDRSAWVLQRGRQLQGHGSAINVLVRRPCSYPLHCRVWRG